MVGADVLSAGRAFIEPVFRLLPAGVTLPIRWWFRHLFLNELFDVPMPAGTHPNPEPSFPVVPEVTMPVLLHLSVVPAQAVLDPVHRPAFPR